MSADIDHDPHSSFIKTPQQLIVVVLLAFLIPIIGIILIVQLVISKPSADPNALTPESVAERLQPVGHVEFAAGGAAAGGARSGEQVVKEVCSTCHQAGVAGAPKIGDTAAWAPRIKQGLNALIASATKGKGAMPPKGGNASLSDDEVARAVVFLANSGGAKFKEPAAPKAAAAPVAAPAAAQSQASAAPDGKKVFDSVCTACHTAGVAGAPKLGDKAAWAPRIKTGIDSLVQSVTKGKGTMPPKGGNPSLTEADLRAAVEFMVSQSK
ncbi:MAG TPA: c-type cytochrome [Burkholderiales bacterium]